jgi:hypothetical protein
LNQLNAREIDEVIHSVYDEYEHEVGQEWARWRLLPVEFGVAFRKTPCAYCEQPIICGQLRINQITCHIECYIRQMQEALGVLERIHQRMIDRNIQIIREEQNEPTS